MSIPETISLSRIANPHWIARAGPSKSAEKPVSSRIDLPSSEVLQLPTNGVVMHRQELVPPPIAELSRGSGRPNDVSEEHGRRHTVEHGTWPEASDELLYLVQDLLDRPAKRK